MLGQGIPFVHAGQDILRSKSMDRDSFNAGDWFNKVDWTFSTTNWAIGLPIAEKNQDKWGIMQPLLANPALAPQSDDVFQSAERFIELVAIRKSSGLFRLRTANDVKSRVAFHNTGPAQIPGLVVASISDDYGSIDLRNEMIVTLFNAGDEAVSFGFPAADNGFDLHPIQADSVDPIVRGAFYDDQAESFEIPARTAAVFTVERPVAEMIDFLIDQVDALVEDGTLGRGTGWSMKSKLRLVKRSLRRDRLRLANKLMNYFIREVEILVFYDRLPEEDGEPLLESARIILDGMN